MLRGWSARLHAVEKPSGNCARPVWLRPRLLQVARERRMYRSLKRRRVEPALSKSDLYCATHSRHGRRALTPHTVPLIRSRARANGTYRHRATQSRFWTSTYTVRTSALQLALGSTLRTRWAAVACGRRRPVGGPRERSRRWPRRRLRCVQAGAATTPPWCPRRRRPRSERRRRATRIDGGSFGGECYQRT